MPGTTPTSASARTSLQGVAGTATSQPLSRPGPISETRRFVERALLDFELSEAFARRSCRERAAFLEWIAAASDASEMEDRVSCLLDALDCGGPLVPVSNEA